MINVSIEKKKAYQERARQKQIAKINSPEYKAKMQLKAKASYEKAKAKQAEKRHAKVKTKAKTKTASVRLNTPAKPRKPIKSKGLLGSPRSKSDIELHDKMAELGCICCIKQGLILPFSGSPVSIHHTAGRTTPNCHKKVLPLCAWHHDTPIPINHPNYTQYAHVFPIHAKGNVGGKVAWEKVNGTQEALILEVLVNIGLESVNDIEH